MKFCAGNSFVCLALLLLIAPCLVHAATRRSHATYGGSLIISNIETTSSGVQLLVTLYPVSPSGQGKQTRIVLDNNIDHISHYSIVASTIDLTLNELYVLTMSKIGSPSFTLSKFDCGEKQPKLIETLPFAQGIPYESASEFVQGFFYVNRLMGSGYLMAVLRPSANNFNIYMINPFDPREMNLVTGADLPSISQFQANRASLFNLRTEKFYMYDSMQATLYQVGPFNGTVQSLNLKKLVPYFEMENLNPIMFYNMTYGGPGSLYLAPSTNDKSPDQPLFEIIPNAQNFEHSIVREIRQLKVPFTSYSTMCIYEDTVLAVETAQFHGYSIQTGKLVFQSEYMVPTPSWSGKSFGLTYNPYH